MNRFRNTRPTLLEQKQEVRHWFLGISFRCILFGLIVCFGFLYIVQITSVSTKGYEMSDTQKKIHELKKETKELEVQIAKHQSLQNIHERLKETNMVVATDVQYISLSDAVVVKR